MVGRNLYYNLAAGGCLGFVTQCVVYRGDEVAYMNRVVSGFTCEFVANAKHLATLDATAR